MQRILIIEDEEDIQMLLRNYLQEEGYGIVVAGDGWEGMRRFHEQTFDLVLLDLMLPGLDGFAVCQLIRQESQVPIMMLTALDSEESQIRGLDLQADDYITKPFSMPVLLRKIAAVLRRSAKEPEANRIVYQELLMDLESYQVSVRGQEAELTQREFELLHVFLRNQGRVLTRQMLLDQVWGMDYFGDERIVDTHVKNLRKKLSVDYIQTIRGVGYRIDRANKAKLNC